MTRDAMKRRKETADHVRKIEAYKSNEKAL